MTQLSLAGKQHSLASISCVQARAAAASSQDNAVQAFRSLQHVKRIASDKRNALPALTVTVALARYDDKTQAARDASRTRKNHEQHFLMAQKEAADAEFELDCQLASQGVLPLKPSKREEDQPGPCADWMRRCDQAFTDYSRITKEMIQPPPLKESEKHALSCRNRRAPRPTAACECAVRRAFRSDRTINLRAERIRWAPENFAACDENVRGELVSMAAYVFRIVDGMYMSIPR